MKQNTMKILLTGAFICYAFASNSMSFPRKSSKPPKHPVTDNPGHHNAPFDGGLSLLLAAGVTYGVNKAYKKRKAKLIS
jgi:hypothetical protein